MTIYDSGGKLNRGDHDGLVSELGLDPAEYGVTPDEARRLYRIALESASRTDDILMVFDDLLREHRARPPVSPGKRTRSLRLAELRALVQGPSDVDPEALPAAPLPDRVRRPMERAFGVNLADVRIHPSSAEASGSMRAAARGHDVFFREGEYAPGTSEGDWLIAHELAHVVQQTRTGGDIADRASVEADADRAADDVLAGDRPSIAARATYGASFAARTSRSAAAARRRAAGVAELAAKLDLLEADLLANAIDELVAEVGRRLKPFVLNQVDRQFSGDKLEALKLRMSAERAEAVRRRPWAPGAGRKRSLGMKPGRRYTFSEGQRWSRLDFLSTMIGSLSTAREGTPRQAIDAVLLHFQNVREAEVPGQVWLHDKAATHLEAVCQAFGRHRFPKSYVALQLRGRHQERHSRGKLMHPLGYAIDFYPTENPMLTSRDLHTLLGEVGGGPTHLELPSPPRKGERSERESSLSPRDETIAALGADTMSGRPHHRDGAALLEHVNVAYGRMAETSDRFRAVLGDAPAEREAAVQRLEALRATYVADVRPLKQALQRAELAEARAEKKVERARKDRDKATRAWEKASGLTDSRPRPKGARLVRLVEARFDAIAAYDAAVEELRERRVEVTKARSALATEAVPLAGRMADALSPLRAALDAKIAEAASPGERERRARLVEVRRRLDNDFEFVLGATDAYEVKNPSVLQLADLGFVRNDPHRPDDARGEAPLREFNGAFVQTMSEHGFVPGAAWKGSTDTMHFDFAEGKRDAEGSSPEKGLDVLLRYLVQRSGHEAGPERSTPEGTEPA